jgi:hypothetical protein
MSGYVYRGTGEDRLTAWMDTGPAGHATGRRRGELEAELWRRWPGCTPADADAILAAADRYRDTAVGETVKRMTGRKLASLGRAEAENYRRRAS